jgi:hypothetical protein
MAIVLDGTAGTTTPALTNSALTSGRVTYAGTSGVLQDSANLVFDGNNLGLGVTPSAWNTGKAMQIGSGAADLALFCNNNDANILSNAYYNGGWKYQWATSVPASRYQQTNGTHVFYNAPSGTAGNAITFTQAMTLDASGNLGVGVTSINQTGAGVARVVSIGGTNQAFIEYIGATGSGLVTGSLHRNASALVGGIYVENNTGNQGIIEFNTNDGTTYAERARIDSSGNLGLGVTPSAWQSSMKALQIGSTTFVRDGSSVSIFGNNYYTNSSVQNIYSTTNFATAYAQNGGQHQWYTAPSGTAGNPITFTQAMTLDASGNLAVGTTSPSSLRLTLEANGNQLRLRNTTTRYRSDLTVINTGTAEWNCFDDTGGVYMPMNLAASVITFSTGSGSVTERARIDSSGNLGIGTSSPKYLLDVNGNFMTRGSKKVFYYAGEPPNYPNILCERSVVLDTNFTPVNSSSGTDIVISQSTTGMNMGHWIATVNLSGDDNGTGVGLTRMVVEFDTYLNNGGGMVVLNPKLVDYYSQVGQYYAFVIVPNIAISYSGSTIRLTVAGYSDYSTGLCRVEFYGSCYGGASVGGLISLSTPGTSSSTSWLKLNGWLQNNSTSLTQTNASTYYTNGSTSAVINSSGNLGLGVTPSAWSALGGIETMFKATGYFAHKSFPNTYTVGNAYYDGSNWIYGTTGYSAAYYAVVGQTGVHQWLTAPSGTAGNAITFTQAMTLDASGNLLVGTTTVGDVAMITAVAPASRRGISAKTVTSAYGVLELWNAATTGDNAFVDFYTEAGQSVRGSITYNRAGGLTAYNTTSDYRAKDIIGPVQDSGATIDALKVYEGQMKGATQSRPMLIAHEAQAVTPYAVTGEKDAVKEDGTPDYQQMDVSSLVPLLIAEIQSLRIRIAQLEAK